MVILFRFLPVVRFMQPILFEQWVCCVKGSVKFLFTVSETNLTFFQSL